MWALVTRVVSSDMRELSATSTPVWLPGAERSRASGNTAGRFGAGRADAGAAARWSCGSPAPRVDTTGVDAVRSGHGSPGQAGNVGWGAGSRAPLRLRRGGAGTGPAHAGGSAARPARPVDSQPGARD